MHRLRARDLAAVLDAVHAVSQATSRDEFSRLALCAVHGVVRSEVTSLNEVDPAAGRLVFAAEPADFPFPPGAQQLFASLANEHPLIRRYLDTGDGSALKISDVCSREVWHATQLFRSFYGPLGLHHQMSFVLPAPLPLVVGLALNRSDTDFDERDRAILTAIRPHLAQAWRRAREYERLEVLVNAASRALVSSGAAVIVVRGPVDELTPGALATLCRYFGASGSRDPLPPPVRRWLASQQELGGGGASSLELGRPLRGTVDGAHLTLRHLPGAGRYPDAILLDEQPVDQPTTALRDAGLTAREVTVLTMIGSGATNAELAQQLSLSPWTVKRHLANIYAKLGVSGRMRAAAVAHEIAAHHREHGGSELA